MSGNIRLTRDEMNSVLRNMTRPSQSTMVARRMFFDEIGTLDIDRQSDGVSIYASSVDFQGLDEVISNQKQYTKAIKIANISIGKYMLDSFSNREFSGTNSTRIIDGKPTQVKQPFSTQESTILAA